MTTTPLRTTAIPSIEKGYIDAPAGKLHYWQAGRGPTLLLIHQSSSTVEEFAALVPLLADKYHLVAFDLPGHGNSDDPAGEPEVEDYAYAAIRVLDSLNVLSAHVLGHHGGSVVAMCLAWKHPRRVNRLILSGTSGPKSRQETELFANSLNLEERNRIDYDGKSLSEAWHRFVGYMPASSPEGVLTAYLSSIASRLRPYDAHHAILRWDRQLALDNITDRRVLLLQGENDPYVSRQEQLLGLLPGGQRHVVEDTGIYLFYEKPEEVSVAILEFLAE